MSKKAIIFAISIVILGLATTAAAGVLATRRVGRACTVHQVTIEHNQVNPYRTAGRLCDTLTITNLDPQNRLVAFGEHEHHQPYDGVTERWLHQGESLTVTLNQTGIFSFHDHVQDEVQGLLVVNK